MILAASLSALCLSLSAITQMSASPAVPSLQTAAQPDQVIRELLALEDQWATGVVHRDRALFERLLAPRFIYTEDDKLMTRADVIDGVASGPDTVTSARNDSMVVHRFGQTTAVVTGWLTLIGRGPNGAFTRRFRFTDTWLRRGTWWQVIAAHDYLVPSAKVP